MIRVIAILLTVGFVTLAQEPVPPAVRAAAPEFFSGSVRALAAGRMTVHRKGLGSNSVTKTFIIDPETKMEGKPRVNGNVTVQYTVNEDGSDRAVHIIVR